MAENISIAEAVLGVRPSQEGYEAVAQAYHTITGELIDEGQAEALMTLYEQHENDGTVDSLPVDILEQIVTVLDLHQAFVECNPQDSNVFVDWPTYSTLLERYGNRGDGSAAALLLGCRSALSAHAFTSLATEVYGANQHHIVDLQAGAHKRRIGNFMLGNALELRYASESMDFVQTNQLIHQLYDPGHPEETLGELTKRLLSEACRVLAPGGQLLMQERCPGAEQAAEPLKQTLAMGKFIIDQCKAHGMSSTGAELLFYFTSADYLRDPSRAFETHNRPGSHDNKIALYARKPAALADSADR